MKITCPGILNGYFMNRFGSKGPSTNGMCGISIPFYIEDAPKGTISFSIILDDYDAVPVCGFVWIHWLIADLTREYIYEGESNHSMDFVEGCNSWYSTTSNHNTNKSIGYGGMSPPDMEHRYTLKAYALDTKLGLKRGFMLNDLYFGMQGHILAHSKIIGRYSPK